MSEERETELPPEENGLTLDADESQELQEIFSTIFPQYLIPIDELVNQILDHDTSDSVLDGLRSAIQPLSNAAESIGASQINTLLIEFQAAIDHQADSEAPEQDLLIDVYYRLKETVQGLAGAPSQPSPTSSDFVARLEKVEGLEPKGIQSVLAAGLGSAEQIAGARVDEIAAVTGLDTETALRLHEAFAAPARETTETAAADPPAGSRPFTDAGGRGSKPPDTRHHRSLPADLDPRLALVVSVRNRLRLTEMIERELQTQLRLRDDLTDAQKSSHSLTGQIVRAREQLEREQSLHRSTEHDLRHLHERALRDSGSASPKDSAETVESLQQLHTRLQELCRRATDARSGK